jgi:hypothetical protein
MVFSILYLIKYLIMGTKYKYEAANANGTLKKHFDTEREAKDFAQEKMYEYPTYTIKPLGKELSEDKQHEQKKE